jgi:hypothetical protein
VIYVTYAQIGIGPTSDHPISAEIEDQINLLLDDIVLKLNS